MFAGASSQKASEMKRWFVLGLSTPPTLLAITACLPWILGCGDDTVEVGKGALTVAVYDQGDPAIPVPDVEIRVVPGDLVSTTDGNGETRFELSPGDYFVDASVCCAGPGTIDYHEPASVMSERTTEVILPACLACVCKPQLVP